MSKTIIECEQCENEWLGAICFVNHEFEREENSQFNTPLEMAEYHVDRCIGCEFCEDFKTFINEKNNENIQYFFTPNRFQKCPNNHGYIRLQSRGKYIESATFFYNCDSCDYNLDVTEKYR